MKILWETVLSIVVVGFGNVSGDKPTLFSTDGPCLSSEPKGIAVNDKLRYELATKEFYIPISSEFYAALHLHIVTGGGPVSNESALTGKFETNKKDMTLIVDSAKKAPLTCEILSPTKKKCSNSDKTMNVTISPIWATDKRVLDLGCTHDKMKFWVVFSTTKIMDDSEKNLVLDQIEKLGFDRTKFYVSRFT